MRLPFFKGGADIRLKSALFVFGSASFVGIVPISALTWQEKPDFVRERGDIRLKSALFVFGSASFVGIVSISALMWQEKADLSEGGGI